MALFENFPYTNLHELNLNWLIDVLKTLEENSVISVNGQTGQVILYQNARMELPAVDANDWSIVRNAHGVQAGIWFAGTGTAYIVHGNLMDQIFTENHQPPYPVTRVNGQTGDITLYAEQFVRLPDLTGESLSTWNIYRKINNINHGIQFDTDGTAYIMNGTDRYTIYTEHDEPEYPVESVNGETGNIRLYYAEGNDIEFLGISPEESTTYNSWSISRALNDSNETVLSLEITQSGQLKLHIGNTVYSVYSTANPQPTWVDDPNADIIEVSDQASAGTWGFIRETNNAPVGILFDNSVQNTPKAYIRYTDSNNTVQTIQLLSRQDIPSSSGVISINNMDGVVVLTGANIDVSATDARHVNVVLSNLETGVSNNQAAMAFDEPGNNATHNIPSGSYVYWNGGAYIANQNIDLGAPLSSTNLNALPAGGFINELNTKIKTVDSKLIEVSGTVTIADGTSGVTFTTIDNSAVVPTGYNLIALTIGGYLLPYVANRDIVTYIENYNKQFRTIRIANYAPAWTNYPYEAIWARA